MATLKYPWETEKFDEIESYFKARCSSEENLNEFIDIFSIAKTDYLYLVEKNNLINDKYFLNFFFIICLTPYISKLSKRNSDLGNYCICHLCQLFNLNDLFCDNNGNEVVKIYLKNTEDIQIIKNRLKITVDFFLFHTSPLDLIKETDFYTSLTFFKFKIRIKNEYDWIFFEGFPEILNSQKQYDSFDYTNLKFHLIINFIKNYFLSDSNICTPYTTVLFERSKFILLLNKLIELESIMTSKKICLLESFNLEKKQTITFISDKITQVAVEPRVFGLIQNLQFQSTTYTALAPQLNSSFNTLKNAQTYINKLSKRLTGFEIIASKKITILNKKNESQLKSNLNKTSKDESFRYITDDFAIIFLCE